MIDSEKGWRGKREGGNGVTSDEANAYARHQDEPNR